MIIRFIKKMKYKIIGVSFLLSFLIPAYAYADYYPDQQHRYVREATEGTCRGGYFYSPTGQGGLNTNWSANKNHSFITSEMWIGLDPNVWVEAGDVDGSVNGYHWAGHYYAYQGGDGDGVYHEFTCGNNHAAGNTSYSIYNLGNYMWQVYVDGNSVIPNGGKNMLCNDGTHVRAGIESNDAGNYFANGITHTYLSTKGADNVWRSWSSLNVQCEDLYARGWHSTYSQNNNTDTYYVN